jgi:hypothetical protein
MQSHGRNVKRGTSQRLGPTWRRISELRNGAAAGPPTWVLARAFSV